ncbi:uncharacterized protein METZ01_LOCUS452006 [marine metagenome]|uniref:Uncharacterized protein n=1 Tax=marine metagenome TaxID=408172 RepID=A0A382ZUK5_9ZZZZ
MKVPPDNGLECDDCVEVSSYISLFSLGCLNLSESILCRQLAESDTFPDPASIKIVFDPVTLS